MNQNWSNILDNKYFWKVIDRITTDMELKHILNLDDNIGNIFNWLFEQVYKI